MCFGRPRPAQRPSSAVRRSVPGRALLAGGGIGAITGAVGGVIASFVEQMGGVMDAFAQATRMSKEFGLSIQQIETLQYAAQRTGADTEAMGAGLRKFSDTLAQAKGGSVEAGAGFAALHISLDKLKNVDTYDALNLVADSLKNTNDPAQRVAIAVDLFGRSGAQLIPMLSQGSEGLRRYFEEGIRNGNIHTHEGVKKLSELREAQKNINTAWNGLVSTMTVALAPAITFVIKALDGLVMMANKVAQWITGNTGRHSPISQMAEAPTDEAKKKPYWYAGKRVTLDEYNALAGNPPRDKQPAWGGLGGAGFNPNGTDRKNDDYTTNKRLVQEAVGQAGKTPLEAFGDTMKGLALAFQAGQIGADRYALAVNKTAETLAHSTGLAEAFSKVAPSHALGSDASAEALQQYRQMFSPANDPKSLLNASLSAAERAQVETKDTARDILNFLQSQTNNDYLKGIALP
jgi:hypothetical protein